MSSPALDSPASPFTEIRTRLLERIGERKLEIPMLPQTASDVMTVCNDSSCDAMRLANLIQRDQALAAHTLHISNSAAYAPREPIVSLQQAVSRLGFKTMCDIAVAVAMRGKVFAVKGQEERVRNMWMHSAMSGAWAKEIARTRRRNVEGAFLCGLLHDIGRPVILQATLELCSARPAGGSSAPDRSAGQDGPSMDDLLERLMQEFHCEVGGLVLEQWKLPGWMCAAVRAHHDPQTAGEHVEYARTAQLADLMSHACEHPDPEADEVLKTHPVLADLDLYADEADALFARRATVIETANAFR